MILMNRLYVEAVCDEDKPYTYAEALAICKEETGKVFEGVMAEEKYISKIETDVFKKKDIDETYEGTILLEKDAGAEKYLMKLKTTLLRQCPLTAALKKSFLCFLLKNIDKLCGHPLGRILIEISRFVKGEVELGDFINGYRENLLVGTAHIDGYCNL